MWFNQFPLLLLTITAHAQEPPLCKESLRTSSGGIITSVNYDRRLLEAHVGGNCIYKVASYSNFMQFHVTNIESSTQNRSNCNIAVDCCRYLQLVIRSDFGEERVFCAQNISTKDAHQLRGNVFSIDYSCSDIYPYAVRIAFTTSRICNSHQYQCADMSGCYQKHEICDRYAHCLDRSDEVQCSRRSCSNYYVDDAYFLCNNGRCVSPLSQKDGKDDCGDGSDEQGTGKRDTILTLLFIFLAFTFFGLVGRWYLFRRDVQHVLNNLPEFPLPPFVAPGEQLEQNEEHRPEVLGGDGDNIEEYVEGMRMRPKRTSRDSKTKSLKTGDPDDSVAALQSLSIDYNQCLGLRKEDQERLEAMGLRSPPRPSRVSKQFRDSLEEIPEIDDINFRPPVRPRAQSDTSNNANTMRISLDDGSHLLLRAVKSTSARYTSKKQEINFVLTLKEINDSLAANYNLQRVHDYDIVTVHEHEYSKNVKDEKVEVDERTNPKTPNSKTGIETPKDLWTSIEEHPTEDFEEHLDTFNEKSVKELSKSIALQKTPAAHSKIPVRPKTPTIRSKTPILPKTLVLSKTSVHPKSPVHPKTPVLSTTPKTPTVLPETPTDQDHPHTPKCFEIIKDVEDL